MPEEKIIKLKETIRSIHDWPIKGVIFRDLTTLMQNPEAFRDSCDILFDRYKDQNIDKIVGIDARGFVFGAVLAYKLGIGFVPVRKKGKLPFKTIEESYSLEYGEDTLEIHEDAVQRDEKIVIIDDLIATGGTIGATVKLVKKLGADIVECAFVVELPDLKGRDQIQGCKIYSITQFEGEQFVTIAHLRVVQQRVAGKKSLKVWSKCVFLNGSQGHKRINKR